MKALIMLTAQQMGIVAHIIMLFSFALAEVV